MNMSIQFTFLLSCSIQASSFVSFVLPSSLWSLENLYVYLYKQIQETIIAFDSYLV